MDLSDLPQLCTPTEAAVALRWNRPAVLKACREGRLSHVRLSKNQLLIDKTDLTQFLETCKCRGQTEAPRSDSGKTGTAGASPSSPRATSNGTQQVAEASRMIKESLRASSSTTTETLVHRPRTKD